MRYLAALLALASVACASPNPGVTVVQGPVPTTESSNPVSQAPPAGLGVVTPEPLQAHHALISQIHSLRVEPGQIELRIGETFPLSRFRVQAFDPSGQPIGPLQNGNSCVIGTGDVAPECEQGPVLLGQILDSPVAGLTETHGVEGLRPGTVDLIIFFSGKSEHARAEEIAVRVPIRVIR